MWLLITNLVLKFQNLRLLDKYGLIDDRCIVSNHQDNFIWIFEMDLRTFDIIVDNFLQYYMSYLTSRRHIESAMLDFSKGHVVFESVDQYEYFKTLNTLVE